MKAVRSHKRGGPEQLVYEEAPMPLLAPGDALIRVHASGITPSELGWGSTWTTKDGAPRVPTIPGHELSGVVAALAPQASGLTIGEAVYGLTDFWRDGTAAEYVAVRAEDLAPKPESLAHALAAAVPLSALTAWQALFDHARLRAGQCVLVHGAAGGVGSYAVQLAHWAGARTIGTARARDAAFLRELGCDEIIDYSATRFEEVVRDADVVLDTVGGETLQRSVGVMRPGGTLVSFVEEPPARLAQARGVQAVTFIVEPSRPQLLELTPLINGGRVRPIVDAIFPLACAREAYERGLTDHVRGKIVLQVAE